MNWHNAAMAVAGLIGCGVALVHGVLTQRLMVRPFEEIVGGRVSGTIRRLIAPLLQFSTYNWFLGGVALIVAAWTLGYEARLVTGLLVGSSYLFGAIGNIWATRGRHPGGLFYATAVVLIAYSLQR